MQKPEQTAQTPAAPATRPYEAPAVQDLGSWQALTLLYTVPVGPGSVGGLGNIGGNSSNGSW